MYPKRNQQQDEKFPASYYGFRFEPQQIGQNKLFIKVYDKKNVYKYFGQLEGSKNVNLRYVCKQLQKQNYQLEKISQDEFYVDIGAIRIQLKSVQKQEKNLLQERIKVLEQKIKQQEGNKIQERLKRLEQRQSQNQNKIDQHQRQIQSLQVAIKDIKQDIIKDLKAEFDQKINDINDQLAENYVPLNQYQTQIQQLKDNTMAIIDFRNEKNTLQDLICSQRKQLDDIIRNIRQEQLAPLTRQSGRLLSDILTKSRQITDIVNRLDLEKSKVSAHQQSIQKINQQLKNISPFPWGFSHQNQPIKSRMWSTQLKSNHIQINGNVAKLKKQTKYGEYCLLNASFSNTIKTKQSWAIKIKKKNKVIYLGVCLKSKMLNYNFNLQNIYCGQTGHGLYMIGSSGYCSSHSQKEFNNVIKSFKFGENDVIYVEYDPINLKLRFSKNKEKYFEMSIIAPPQNDAYHPFVSLAGQNDLAELVPYQ